MTIVQGGKISFSDGLEDRRMMGVVYNAHGRWFVPSFEDASSEASVEDRGEGGVRLTFCPRLKNNITPFQHKFTTSTTTSSPTQPRLAWTSEQTVPAQIT